MKKAILPVIIFIFSGFVIYPLRAQVSDKADSVASTSDYLVAQPVPDRTVFYNISDTGVSRPLIWGLDLAWLDATNIRRGIAFMGANRVDVVRSSFMPTNPLVGDSALQGDALTNTNKRLDIIKNYLGPNTKVVLNCDHPNVDPYFLGNAPHWAKLIDVTTKLHEKQGRTVVSVSPFNEPDYGWGQYTGQNGKSDFYNICGELKNNPDFDSIRISGGNTLNCDQALPWYDYLKDRLDEGNTHQLAGSFDSFANFFQTVRANEDHATDDELHNVMEAMVGAEYGLQTGIWWGTAELARGEFVIASDGKRLGYAEDRPNWTAASVYRNQQGRVQAFGGTSERQAATTTYCFVSKDRPVYYDGYGPQYEYTMLLPGGTGYQQGQTNAERVVNITWGDDIQPVIKGQYALVNRASGQVMEVANGSASAGANIQQGINSGATYQQWNVTPVSSRIGGDFSYFTITAVNSGKSLDVFNWSLDNNGNIALWNDTKGANQQWYLEYAGEGWFYIRSRFSSKCLEVVNSSSTDGANIEQWDKNGGTNQQWRFIQVGAPVEFEIPSAPANLVATANATSVRLDWIASPENDIAGYTILRAANSGGPYNTIARNVTSFSFIDNTTISGKQYFYVIKAVDYSLNTSASSNEVSATATGDNELTVCLPFNGNTRDSTINLNHSATYGDTTFVAGKIGSGAISLNGKNSFIQLPATIANHQGITIATWVYWRGGPPLQRIFDFGNGEEECMFLTPASDVISGQLRFSIKNGNVEEQLNTPHLALYSWTHVAVTLEPPMARMYVNGELVAESDNFKSDPQDFKPVLNYIGRSQHANDPLFNGYIDDFRIYNYALQSGEITQLSTDTATNEPDPETAGGLSVWPVPANDVLNVNYSRHNNNDYITFEMLNANGKIVIHKNVRSSVNTQFNVSELPEGIYILKLFSRNGSVMKKIIIKH